MKKAKIGIDARGLGTASLLRGIGRYITSLLESLVRISDDYEYVLHGYGDEPDPELFSPQALKRMEWQRIRGGGQSRLAMIMDYWNLAEAVSDSGVDLFHGIDQNLSPFLRCPSIATVHDLIVLVLRGIYLGPTSYLQLLAHRRACSRANIVVADSQATREDIVSCWKIPPERIVVVPLGVDPAYRPVNDQSSAEDLLGDLGIRRPYFLYVGGFDPRKNIRTTMLAYKRFLSSSDEDVMLVLCGDLGGVEGQLRDEVADLGLEGRVALTGFVPDEHLPALYGHALAAVLVSLYEGFGLPMLEAMACGTPVLSSNLSSIPEVVGDAGILVDPVDTAAIANGMRELSARPGLRRELASRGMVRASGFTWDNTAEEAIRLYGRILS